MDDSAEILERLLDQGVLGYDRYGVVVLLLRLNWCLSDVEASGGDWLAVVADEDVSVKLCGLKIDQFNGFDELPRRENCRDELINILKILEAGALMAFHDSNRQFTAVIERFEQLLLVIIGLNSASVQLVELLDKLADVADLVFSLLYVNH